jgi:hypothetical protein
VLAKAPVHLGFERRGLGDDLGDDRDQRPHTDAVGGAERRGQSSWSARTAARICPARSSSRRRDGDMSQGRLLTSRSAHRGQGGNASRTTGGVRMVWRPPEEGRRHASADVKRPRPGHANETRRSEWVLPPDDDAVMRSGGGRMPGNASRHRRAFAARSTYVESRRALARRLVPLCPCRDGDPTCPRLRPPYATT